MLDASRVVDVVSNLLNPGERPRFEQANRTQQATLREQHAARRERPLLVSCRARQPARDRLARGAASVPASVGRRQLDAVPLEDLLPLSSWTFFFAAWELKGRFPAILDHPQCGSAARDLYANARSLLDRIVAERLIEARGVCGFWPAASDGDDIIVFGDESRSGELLRFNMLASRR